MNEIYQLSAEDARAITKEVREKREDIIIKLILNCIRSCAEMGEYEFSFCTEDILDLNKLNDEEMDNVIVKIRKLGYHVYCVDDTAYNISWSE